MTRVKNVRPDVNKLQTIWSNKYLFGSNIASGIIIIIIIIIIITIKVCLTDPSGGFSLLKLHYKQIIYN